MQSNCIIPPGINDHIKVLKITFENEACRPEAFAIASA